MENTVYRYIEFNRQGETWASMKWWTSGSHKFPTSITKPTSSFTTEEQSIFEYWDGQGRPTAIKDPNFYGTGSHPDEATL